MTPQPTPNSHLAYRAISRLGGPAIASDETTIVRVGRAAFGAPEPVIIAGPCAVESEAQTLAIARAARACGADMLRGGAYKPRTSPHDFQGLGEDGLKILAAARAETGLPVVTEVIDVRLVEKVARYADMLQVGSRSMQNFPLLVEIGRTGMPVLLKRAMAATLFEWLCAAEYIAAEGNLNIVFCERGVRSAAGGRVLAVLARPQRRRCAARGDAPAGDRRPQPRDRARRVGAGRGAGGDRVRGARADRRDRRRGHRARPDSLRRHARPSGPASCARWCATSVASPASRSRPRCHSDRIEFIVPSIDPQESAA